MAYGLESAVVHFNRLPQLGVAAARRLFLERLAMLCKIIEALRHVYRPIGQFVPLTYRPFPFETSVFHQFLWLFVLSCHVRFDWTDLCPLDNPFPKVMSGWNKT